MGLQNLLSELDTRIEIFNNAKTDIKLGPMSTERRAIQETHESALRDFRAMVLKEIENDDHSGKA